MNIEECLEEGFLKKIKAAKEEIGKELKESDKDFNDSKDSLQQEKYKWCIIQAYYSMFHSARAVIMSLGYKERRHFAVGVVLESLVKGNRMESYFLDDFKAAMFAREEADYGASYSRERAEQMLTMAEEFGDRMKKMAKGK